MWRKQVKKELMGTQFSWMWGYAGDARSFVTPKFPFTTRPSPIWISLPLYKCTELGVVRADFSAAPFQLVLSTENLYFCTAEKSTLRLNKVGIGNVLYLQWPESEPRYNYLHCLASSSGKHHTRSINGCKSIYFSEYQ